MSSGGWFGVGLGQSRFKWGLLPNAHTDYIFAIVGEELGLVGSLLVLALFAVLGYAGLRIARRSTDPFVRLASAAVTVWLVGQALINIGYVTGLLPVTGIPLPLISFGGTSLIVTLFALGHAGLLRPARAGRRRGLRAKGPSRTARLLWLPTPSEAREKAPRVTRIHRDRPARPAAAARRATPPARGAAAGSARQSAPVRRRAGPRTGAVLPATGDRRTPEPVSRPLSVVLAGGGSAGTHLAGARARRPAAGRRSRRADHRARHRAGAGGSRWSRPTATTWN